MRNVVLSCGLMLAVTCVLTGCQSPTAQLQAPSSLQSTRNNCYSLLYQLMEDEKDVSYLRFIRPENLDLKNLTKKISSFSKETGKQLKEMARQDSSLGLDDLRLPSGEVMTRDAIAVTKRKDLLGQKGNQFELSLLLTQTEALNYGWHLALVAAQHDDHPDRVRILNDLGNEMKNLYQEVYDLLLTNTKASASARP